MTHTILAVDDSASMRQMVGHVLRTAGFLVFEAGDGAEALEIAARERIDAVVTDHNMPEMDGISLVRRLRALEEHATTPILLLTTESSAEVKQLGREAGATGWIVKPFDPMRLVEVCRKVLR
jgi:two-component system, chemotaxis family, chemotaxis protein CheY